MRAAGIAAAGIGTGLGMEGQSAERSHISAAPPQSLAPAINTAEILVQGLID